MKYIRVTKRKNEIKKNRVSSLSCASYSLLGFFLSLFYIFKGRKDKVFWGVAYGLFFIILDLPSKFFMRFFGYRQYPTTLYYYNGDE